MYVLSVTIHVKEGFADQFIEATMDNVRGSRREPGNVRYDFHRGADDPNRFLIYEAYRTEADFKAHQQTPHYFAWREAVADWMAQPRQGAKYNSIAPTDPAAW